MNEFLKYQHVEKVGTVETADIENGMCYIFPKIDGTNSQLWIGEGEKLAAGSRNRVLSLENDNAGFYAWALEQNNLINFFRNYQHLRLFGEWLVPHTLKTYDNDAWRKFYVFDVMDGEKYLSYEHYKGILEKYDIEFIPPICKIQNPSYERLVSFLEKNNYLIKDGEGTGEGIVIKRYDYVNKFGRTTWAKIVKNEFKAKHAKCETSELKETKIVEQEIVNKYITLALVEKEHAKIVNEDQGWTTRQIPRLLNTVFYCLIKEEAWNFLKEFKNPTIDFKRLQYFSNAKIKELMPSLF